MTARRALLSPRAKMRRTIVLAALLAAAVAVSAQCPSSYDQWTLTPNPTAVSTDYSSNPQWVAQDYAAGIPKARSLAISKNSKLNGPVITYGE